MPPGHGSGFSAFACRCAGSESAETANCPQASRAPTTRQRARAHKDIRIYHLTTLPSAKAKPLRCGGPLFSSPPPADVQPRLRQSVHENEKPIKTLDGKYELVGGSKEDVKAAHAMAARVCARLKTCFNQQIILDGAQETRTLLLALAIVRRTAGLHGRGTGSVGAATCDPCRGRLLSFRRPGVSLRSTPG